MGKNANRIISTDKNRLKKRMKTMKNNKQKTHVKQGVFFDDKARNRWIFGGNRTGKTYAGAMEAVNRACSNKRKSEGWVVSLTRQVQRDVAQRKILQLLDAKKKKSEGGINGTKKPGSKTRPKEGAKERKAIDYECVMLSGSKDFPEHGIIDFIIVKNYNNRRNLMESRIGFKNCEQGREKFQGTKLDWVWFDEEPPEDIYDECIMRTLDKGGYVWGTMTPLKGRTWVYERIFKQADINPDIKVFSWSWEDNPYLCEKEVAVMERNFSADALESRKHGRFVEGTGLVFSEFSEKNILKNLSKSVSEMLQSENMVYTGITIDPGYINPTAVLWFAIDSDDNYYVIGDYKQAGRSVEQLAKDIHHKSAELGIPVDNVYIDSNAVNMTLGTPVSVAEQFRALGVPVNTQVDKNVLEGIHKVKAMFCSADGTRRLFVYEHCVHLIKELRGYFWGDNDRPHKSDDHCIDALRYFVMTERTKPPPPVTVMPFARMGPLEKFKRRLIMEVK